MYVMPLIQEQKEFIVACIDHLFDLPTQAEDLKSATEKIKQTFKNEIKNADDQPYYQLQECIHHPMRCFNRLQARREQKITFGDVQSYILDLTHDKLNETKANLEELKWDKSEFLEILKKNSIFNIEFKSEPTQFTFGVVHEPPRQEKIFSYKILDDYLGDEDGEHFSFHVEITFNLASDKIIKKTEYYEDIPACSTKEERDKTKKSKKVCEKIETNALRTVLMYLLEEKAVTAQEIRTVSSNARELIIIPVYFNGVKNKIFSFSEMNPSIPSQYRNLKSQAVISLLESQKIAIGFAKKLNKQQLKFVEYFMYNQKLMSGEIKIDEIVDLPENDNIYSPHVIKLINKKIPFGQAKTITKPCRLLIDKQPFLEAIENGKLTYSQIEKITEQQSEILSSRSVSYLVLQGFLSLEKALSLKVTEKQLTLLDNEHIFPALQKNIPYIDFYLARSDDECDILLKNLHPHLIGKQLITPEEALANKISELCHKALDNPVYIKLLTKENFVFFLNLTNAQYNNLLNPLVVKLVEKEIITFREAVSLEISPACNEILNNSTYFKFITKQNVKFFLTLTELQRDHLMNPLIIKLLNTKIIATPQEALELNMTDACKKILKNKDDFYFNIIKKDKAKLNLLKDITDIQVEKLESRIIQNLIRTNKMTLEQALALNFSESHCALFNNQTYSRLIKDNAFDFKLMLGLNERQCQFLLNADLIRLIKYDQISIDNVIMALKNPILLELIEKKVITLPDLEKILPSPDINPSEFKFPTHYDKESLQKTMQAFLALSSDNLLFEKELPTLFSKLDEFKINSSSDQKSEKAPDLIPQFLSNTVLFNACKDNINARLKAINEYKPMLLCEKKRDSFQFLICDIEKFGIDSEDIWISIFTSRLIGIFHHDPFDVHFFQPDDLTKIKDDLKEYVAKKCDITSDDNSFPLVFAQKILKHLIEKILADLKIKLTGNEEELGGLCSQVNQIYIDTIKIEAEASASVTMLWVKAFANLIKVAQDTRFSLWSELIDKKADEPPIKKQKTNTAPTLFKPKSLVKTFCQSLCSLTEFLDFFEIPMHMLSEDLSKKGKSSSDSLKITLRKRRVFA